MNAKTIRVEIVTPVHNRKQLTLRCLRSISKLDCPGIEIHTIVVDDGSTDGTGDAIRQRFPAVEVIRGDGNLWYTEGTNVGLKAALEHDPDYVLAINDDQIFDANALRFLVETAQKHPRSVVGALLLLWDAPHRVFQVSPKWVTASGGWRHWYQQTVWTVPEKPWHVELIVGNCVLIPARAIREEGVMNARRYPMFGDAEYTPRLRRRGWDLLVDPRARVFCQPNTIPPRVRRMSTREKIDALFLNLEHTQNLRRRFYAYWDGAPSKPAGVAAFFVFLLRVLLGKNTEGAWGRLQEEAPLSETYAELVVKD